jgi:uncharacterized Fe-S center protein
MIATRILFTALLAALWSAAAQAQLPQEQTSGNVRFVTGGIGQEEVQALREAAPRYPLAMTFTIASGQFVSDVKVTIRGKGGETILSAVSGGPMMLVDLAPGRYTVEAAFEGKTLTRKVAIAKGKSQRLVLRWPG